MCGETYLDWAVVDEQTVQLREGLTGSIGMVEDDMGNATADTTWAVRQLNPLDLSNGSLEVFLCKGGVVVSKLRETEKREIRRRSDIDNPSGKHGSIAIGPTSKRK